MKTDMSIKLSIVLVSLVIVNFGYQAVTGERWDVAGERSFFQAAALLAAWFSV